MTMGINTVKQVVEISLDDLNQIKTNQEKILNALEDFQLIKPKEYITAEEFMQAVNIKWWKFNKLRERNLIKVIKKSRKVYVPQSEVRRYLEEVLE